MLTQLEVIDIINQNKYIDSAIEIGTFIKYSKNILFDDPDYNKYNLILDVYKSGTIEIKHTIQKRAKKAVPIIRLDILSDESGYHRNPPYIADNLPPDIEENIKSLMQKYSEYIFKAQSHIHYYIEGYGEKWAFPIDEFLPISDDIALNLQNFCNTFNIRANIMRVGLF